MKKIKEIEKKSDEAIKSNSTICEDETKLSSLFEFILSIILGLGIIILFLLYPENQIISGSLVAIIPSILALWIKSPRDRRELGAVLSKMIKATQALERTSSGLPIDLTLNRSSSSDGNTKSPPIISFQEIK